MKTPETQISRIIEMDNPQKVYDEVKTIISMMFDEFNFESLDRVFTDIVKLFKGNYFGYQECLTGYHDIKHTTDAMLAAIRLIHGASLEGETITPEGVTLCIISSLMHDTGYILTMEDDARSGGKYTLVHIDRSIEFMEKYIDTNKLSEDDFLGCQNILHCTGFKTDIDKIEFNSPECELIGKIMGTADLLGQMADRTYLEKLPFLYHEFREANIDTYSSVMDLFEKSQDFYASTRKRFAEELGRKIVANIVMLGFLSALTDFASDDGIRKAIADSVPGGTIDLNMKAYEKGRSYGQELLKEKSSKAKAYWGFLFFIYVLAIGFMTVLPEPVFLVTAAGALSLLFAPVYYFLNYYCVTRLVDEPEYRPSAWARIVAIAGIVFVTLGAGLFIVTRF